MDTQNPTTSNDIPEPRQMKRFPLLTVVLSVLILLLLSSTAYLAYQNMQLQKQIATLRAAPSPTPTPSQASIDIPTNWKMYTDDSYGFSFKYPDSLTISNFYDQNSGSPIKSVLFGFEFKNTNGVTLDTFTIYDSGTSTVENWIKLNKNIIIPVDSSNPVRQSINSLDIYKISHQYGTFYVFSNNNNRIFLFGITGNDALANQILSTFKFLGQSPTPTCRPRPACLDATPRCMIPETPDMCPKASPTPSTTYTCPPSGYVDCMPILDAAKQKACSTDAMTWYKANCPNFKGGAL